MDTQTLQHIEQISALQTPVDVAQDVLNELLSSRRSLAMTKAELVSLRIPTPPLDMELESLGKKISTAAANYVAKKIDAEGKMRTHREKLRSVHSQVESPIDYVKTEVKTMPLAADSINMDVQYFSVDTLTQEGRDFAQSISAFVADSASFLGSKVQSQVSGAVQQQASQQKQSHDLLGTLVLSVSCTHKNASILAPLVLDADKGVKAWNQLYKQDQLDPAKWRPSGTTQSTGGRTSGNKTPSFSIISGMTFGSSFVGMVHVKKTTNTNVSQQLAALATTLQSQMDAGAWFESASGGYGVTSTIGDQVKSLLSAQSITSHVTMVCMGVIPSITANNVKMGVQKFAEFDPASSMKAISTIQNATVADQDSMKRGADAARSGQQMVSLKAGEIKAALSALADVDDGANKILDINSVMTALEDYLQKAAEGKAGVPINYYLKEITKESLVQAWAAKYFPGNFAKKEGDTASKPSAGGQAGGQSGGQTGGQSGSTGGTTGGNTSGAGGGESGGGLGGGDGGLGDEGGGGGDVGGGGGDGGGGGLGGGLGGGDGGSGGGGGGGGLGI
mgnify:CR=1 FL=1